MTLLNCLLLSFILFGIGVFGLLRRRHIVAMLISIELMLNAANMNFISFAYFSKGDASAGAIFSLFVIAITACEMAIALAIVIAMYRRTHSLDIDSLRGLHE
ncbi:MAG: NADH-quinone oxidoreductase subunit NuoK [Fibrobacter sp.]|jgi:NADH:ubiquinone oxidoreductase subunit K|nr:NADH-quinone oxidoreductase subunit NuoK [Fibrobacter sp.]